MLSRIKIVFTSFFLALLVTSCSDPTLTTPGDTTSDDPSIGVKSSAPGTDFDGRRMQFKSVPDIKKVNTQLAERGLNIRLAYAETVTSGNSEQPAKGKIIFENDRRLRLNAQWVPGDPRRSSDGNTLNYITWGPFATANFGTDDAINGIPAIDASFDTWDAADNSSKLIITKRPTTAENPSIILGGNPFLADISQVGFLPGQLFDIVLEPGARENVLGVTFTFVWVDQNDNPTDINNDGYNDVALKEVWYNDDFLWTDAGNSGGAIDIETVALHENGHALGFGHFGKISITGLNAPNLRLHVSPRAVMNAIILGTQRELLGTDLSSYQSIYGDWPAE